MRLWPTTPGILRELTTDTAVGGGSVKKGTGVLIFTPFFHQDDINLPFAHRIEPSLWTEEDAIADTGLVPFSAGPAICPAHNLVPMVASFALWAVVSGASIELDFPQTDPCLAGHPRPFHAQI
ncbi:cytochrome P450 [Neorhizobium petrolearium]|uniref:cytochrome P450 n=1 Tax=Neorhizobium petrolearium TaxID=515361 RepID=UPI003F5CC783